MLHTDEISTFQLSRLLNEIDSSVEADIQRTTVKDREVDCNHFIAAPLLVLTKGLV